MKRVINSVAPIRICDLGGWTDTWFAKQGVILNMGVYPYVQCQMTFGPAVNDTGRLTISAENYGDRYVIDPSNVVYDKHPLLEAAVDAMSIPRDLEIEVNIFSEAPGGCSTGTSAAVSVALIGALDTLTEGRMTPSEVASKAHEIETQMLGLQCGIQDQIASARGGICYIEMSDYPQAQVTRIELSNATWWELESRLVLVYLGRMHNSSKVHEQVIRDLESSGPEDSRMHALRRAASDGRAALLDGDFDAFGKAMIDNNEAQAALHTSLISKRAREVINVAEKHGAVGWKVNGAGGEGGSVTLLSSQSHAAKRAMIRELEGIGDGVRNIPTYLSRYGLRVWEA